jgi:hypothetical protein
LNNLCANAGILVDVHPKQLNALSDYAVRARYPGNEPSLADARDAIEIAQAVRKFARRFLNIK